MAAPSPSARSLPAAIIRGRLISPQSADRLGLSTDCGLINLPRMIAAGKLRALGDGAAIVRAELQG